MKKIVDISGFVYSGKSSVSDILREVDGLIVPRSEEEFDLLRIPNGLIDLKNAVNDWSPIRTYSALLRFEKTAAHVGTRWGFPYKYYKTGLNYQDRYPLYFQYLQTFLNEITYHTWESPWPYNNFDDNALQTFKRKLFERFGFMQLRTYKLVNKATFLASAQKFVSNMLWSTYPNRQEETLITHNALEPFNPFQNSDLLLNCKCIVVDRDPRDIYATAQIIPPGQSDRLNRYRNMCAGHDVDSFIKRYLLYRSMVTENQNVLRLQFSDLILNYENSLQKIFQFLQINPAQHKRKLQSFNPEVSKVSLELYKRDQVKAFAEDFKKIERRLNL